MRSIHITNATEQQCSCHVFNAHQTCAHLLGPKEGEDDAGLELMEALAGGSEEGGEAATARLRLERCRRLQYSGVAVDCNAELVRLAAVAQAPTAANRSVSPLDAAVAERLAQLKTVDHNAGDRKFHVLHSLAERYRGGQQRGPGSWLASV